MSGSSVHLFMQNGRRLRTCIVAAIAAVAAVVATPDVRADTLPCVDSLAPALGACQDGAPDARPLTIPALRHWSAAPGDYRLPIAPRILVRSADAAALRSEADLFAADLQQLTGRRVRVAVSDGAVRDGDLVLALGSDDTDLGEGYRLTIGRSVDIEALEPAGVFYGTRTMLQLLRHGTSVDAWHARDWPRYQERGLMIDIGRKHYTYEWLAERIRDMAYLKLNYLHLHFSEDQGWRIESDREPQLHFGQHLTKDQVRGLVAHAARHHITVVPEIDMPGHMAAALAPHPELQLRDAQGVADPGNIDYTIPAARQFLRELIEEYLPLFPGPY